MNNVYILVIILAVCSIFVRFFLIGPVPVALLGCCVAGAVLVFSYALEGVSK